MSQPIPAPPTNVVFTTTATAGGVAYSYTYNPTTNVWNVVEIAPYAATTPQKQTVSRTDTFELVPQK